MSLFTQFTTDADLERNGILLEYGNAANGKPIRLRVARAGGANAAYQRRMEALVKPYRRQIQTETIEPAVVERLTRQVAAETLLLGWENVDFPETAHGPAITDAPCTMENKLRLFTELPDLYTDVQEQAGRAALYRKEILEAEAGNSLRS